MRIRTLLSLGTAVVLGVGSLVNAFDWSSQHCKDDNSCVEAGNGECERGPDTPDGRPQYFKGGTGFVIQTCQDDLLAISNHVCTMDGVEQICTMLSAIYSSPPLGPDITGCDEEFANGFADVWTDGCND